ncbi:hypothetical protein PUNSTDRAFT_145192 [Punctularia strigosozonata HHB-11173 SS5]|uniref:uncharacterized protein n=1 Tax=Punctularia strigosozonata (strain HHB-11173) TaxID=741275 RepID=UPI00044172F5|nr:uncharacterized protein PUNSTDRAFT_145192 [Punctularia strigosozonata HHB-11173 SS5]EIN06932.1 hypothetical protein PUNSTDRAFT_145192 [Punctularia strigosozonata HHB-11173 SS5]
MYRKLALAAVPAFVALPHVLAQQSAWGQCDGIGWSGATTCVSGYVCTYQNDYYSQCIPGAASSSSSTMSGATSKSSTVSSTSSAPTSTSTTAVNYWFSFGDSYTQTGFVTTDTLPAVGNPLGNPDYPGYTAVGGENWIDVATTVYNHSTVLTWNYAYGGATIDASLVAPYEPTVLSLTDQVNEFLDGAASKPASAPWTSSDALFSVWIGINDIGNSYYQSGSRSAFDSTLLNAYFALVQKLRSDVGARNFLFINVPPIDRSPLMLAQSTDAQALEKTVIADFNSQLVTYVNQFKANNTGVTTWIYDANTAFTTILDSPTTYGFVDATSYGNTGDFWGNNYHPSSAAQVMFGEQVGKLLSGTVW